MVKNSIFLFFLVFILSFCNNVLAEEILVIQSKENRIFLQLWEGIKENSSPPVEYCLLPENPAEKKFLLNKINSYSWKVIIVLGEDALLWIGESLEKDTPVVFGGVSNPERLTLGDNICGISMDYSPSVVFGIFKEILPEIKNIGIIYNPQRSKNIFEQSKKVATLWDINLIGYAAESATGLAEGLRELSGELHAFWMILDPVVANKFTFEALVSFSIKERIPMFVPTESLVKKGAFLGIKDDYKEMGKDIAHLANSILSGEKIPRDIGIQFPTSQKRWVINLGVGKRLGFDVSPEVIKKAASVY